MADEVTPERVRANAAAARAPLEPARAARVAETVSPTVARFAAESVELPFEIEPASFVAIQRGELDR